MKDDLISRQAAIKTIDGMLQLLPYDPLKSDYTQGITIGLSLAESRIKRLLSAQPEQEFGKWIEHKWAEEAEGFLISNYECSYCHSYERKKSYYCPNCGKKMEEKDG